MGSNLQVQCWQMVSANEPLERASREIDVAGLADDQVVVKVAGCGVCHTDLGFLYDGVRTRHALPLTLGHEIAGHVAHAGAGTDVPVGQAVVVPAVLPCGTCAACEAGRGAICPRQVFPGNDDHGGFASHVVVPGHGVCPVDESALAGRGLELADLSVIADAVTTPYQAIVNAGLQRGDLAIVVGVGGVGAFAVQIAHALGAEVVALDVSQSRLDLVAEHGAGLTLNAGEDNRALRKQIGAWAKERGLPRTGWKIFECSGHSAGQGLAFDLLTFGAHLGVVGYTREKISVRLSNLMAFDATARGTWGCLPEHYPAVVDLVLRGEVRIGAFIDRRPMSQINETFRALHDRTLKLRPVLVPDF